MAASVDEHVAHDCICCKTANQSIDRGISMQTPDVASTFANAKQCAQISQIGPVPGFCRLT